jgi:hypothetical protein
MGRPSNVSVSRSPRTTMGALCTVLALACAALWTLHDEERPPGAAPPRISQSLREAVSAVPTQPPPPLRAVPLPRVRGCGSTTPRHPPREDEPAQRPVPGPTPFRDSAVIPHLPGPGPVPADRLGVVTRVTLDGAPAAFARIRLRTEGTDKIEEEVEAGPDGVCTLAFPRVRGVTLRVDCEGVNTFAAGVCEQGQALVFCPGSLNRTGKVSYSETARLPCWELFVSDESTRGKVLRLALVSQLEVRGRVLREPTGDPVANAQVWCLESMALANDAGEFVIRIAPRTDRLYRDSQQAIGAQARGVGFGSAPLEWARLDGRLASKPVLVWLKPGDTFEGRAVDDRGLGVPAALEIQAGYRTKRWYVRCSADGRFRIYGVPPDEDHKIVSMRGQLAGHEETGSASDHWVYRSIDKPAEVVLRRRLPCRGQVVDAKGRGLMGAHVRYVRNTYTVGRLDGISRNSRFWDCDVVECDREGRFKLDAPAGSGWLAVVSPSHGPALAEVVTHSGDIRLQLPASEELSGRMSGGPDELQWLFLLPTGLRLGQHKSWKKATSNRVMAPGEVNAAFSLATVWSDGSFSFEPLPPGGYDCYLVAASPVLLAENIQTGRDDVLLTYKEPPD